MTDITQRNAYIDVGMIYSYNSVIHGFGTGTELLKTTMRKPYKIAEDNVNCWLYYQY